MGALKHEIEIAVGAQRIDGTVLTPETKVPGLLFVHGWGGSRDQDMKRAGSIAALGCVCLTFDLRGHGDTEEQQRTVTREQNLEDVLCAYDLLVSQPSVEHGEIAVIGSSYGGYLAAILTTLRPVRWLALRVPALYRDQQWDTPKRALNRDDLNAYRRTLAPASQNRALGACAKFRGDVLLVESEHDDHVPHQTILSYRRAFSNAHSLTYRLIDGADHALSEESCRKAYSSLLTGWTTEMILGARS
jgi:pimeloyl-ACP methyl ester carboxylesterase